MYRIALFALLGGAAFAQTDASPAEKPPADVEQALRARVNELYTLMKNHEYRKAEGLISEDTKDYYYAGAKPEIHTFEVLDIEFSDRFTHAKAMTKCSQPLVVANFPQAEITLKIPTLWRFENGNWFLYEDPAKIANPTGLQSKIQKAVDAGAAATTPPPTEMPKEIPKDPAFALKKLQVDKSEISLTAGAAEQVAIANLSDGPMQLELGYPLKGIEAKLDRTDVGKGEKAVLTLTAGKEPAAGIFYLRVMPTEETIAIHVQVK